LAYVTFIPPLENTFSIPASFIFFSGIVVQLSAVGGVRVEYAIQLDPYPTAIHVPFEYVILALAPA
jgi:hypothetical protein